jgi:hypothetical protein
MIYNYSNIEFSKKNDRFSHILKYDYGCFVLWKPARPNRNMIRDLLSSKFEILLETEIEWSNENFHNNASRFYQKALYNSLSKEIRVSEHAHQIGDNMFILFVIKDVNPNYSYLKTTSNIIQIGNLNVYNLKKQIRSYIFQEIGVVYPIHSTNGIHEFFFQGPLLLGADLFKRLLFGEKVSIRKISKDLEGADGWLSWSQVFEILNISSNYVSLDYENLLSNNDNGKMIILTDDYQRVASALGLNQFSKEACKGVIKVDNKEVLIDIRFIGDKYFNTSWQKDMLASKIFKNGVFILRSDMHFFSLLFYCKVHQNEVREKHIKALNILAKQLDFVWYNERDLFDDKVVASILKGYFEGHNYHYETPIDKTSGKNKSIIRNLPDRQSIICRESNITLIKKKIKRNIPKPIYMFLKKIASKAAFYV